MSEMILTGSPILKGRQVDAFYRDEINPLYKHNAFIEALPPLFEPKQASSGVSRTPVYYEEMREWPGIQRLDQVMEIAHLVVPLPEHLLLEQQVSRVIRSGYMNRNPISSEWVKQLNSGFEGLNLKDGDVPPIIRMNSSGFAQIGPSGLGKTTAFEGVLSLYPQVIKHKKYGSHIFAHQQIVWLKLECPPSGSTAALCRLFFATVDAVLKNTDYLKKYGNKRRNKDEMLPDMARVAFFHGIGILVIDEIQRLNVAASGGAEEMMHFFTQLTNLIGVPVALVGTSAALRIVTEKFSQARRATGQGDCLWAPMAHSDTWDYFLKKLWRYQFTKTPTPLTDELNAAIYKESCGIIDLAVKLYMLVQWAIIGDRKNKKEMITKAAIQSVAKEKFAFVRPALNKLRGGVIDNFQYLDDLLPSRQLMEECFSQAMEKIVLGETLETVKNQRENDQIIGKDQLLHKIGSLLVMAGFGDEIAELASRKALDRHAEEIDLTIVSEEAMKVASQLKAEKGAKKKKQAAAKVKRKGKKDGELGSAEDLRGAVKAEGNESSYEALSESGDIKSADEFVCEERGV